MADCGSAPARLYQTSRIHGTQQSRHLGRGPARLSEETSAPMIRAGDQPMAMISVIIPTYNRRELLARTLDALFRQNVEAHLYEIIVVVDGSTDGTSEMLKRLKPACGLAVIEQPNCGQASAMNAGARAAHGEILLFIDDDILCDPDLLQHHAAAHASGEGHVVFGPIEIAD